VTEWRFIFLFCAAEVVAIDTKKRTPSANLFALSVSIALELALPFLLVHARR
jgi:hypothetical protein